MLWPKGAVMDVTTLADGEMMVMEAAAVGCCRHGRGRRIEGSESSRRGRHFGWLGSAVRITAGKLAAGSHGCRSWR
ncbi:hypothetical protein ACLOJK_004931 [Asimina triloba]